MTQPDDKDPEKLKLEHLRKLIEWARIPLVSDLEIKLREESARRLQRARLADELASVTDSVEIQKKLAEHDLMLDSWAADLRNEKRDPGYCGLGVETGPRDPFWLRMCQRHDDSFNELKAGRYEGSGLKVAGRAAVDTIGAMAAGAYLVTFAPLYFVGAVFGGLVRWGWLERQQKRLKEWIPGTDNNQSGES